MIEYKYLNGLKVADAQYFKLLDTAVEDVWGKKELGRKPEIRVIDNYDNIVSHPDSDATDEIEFYLIFPTTELYVNELICLAEIIEFSVEFMSVLTSKNGKLIVAWKEKVIYQDLVEKKHVDTSELVSVGNKFIQEVKSLKNNGEPVNLKGIREILNCLKLDFGWYLGLRFAEIKDFGDKSWFYCHQGDDTYCEDYLKTVKSGNYMTPFWKYYDFAPIYDIYKHMIVKWSEMGVWQAYLLSKATALLPFVWHGGYGRKTLLFCKEDKAKIPPLFKRVDIPDVEDDLSPKVRIEGNVATVSCCFWNDWRGLYRETEKITLNDTRLEFDGNSKIDVLFKYECGVRY